MGAVTGIRRRRPVAGRRETPHLSPDRGFYGQTLFTSLPFAIFARVEVDMPAATRISVRVICRSMSNFHNLSKHRTIGIPFTYSLVVSFATATKTNPIPVKALE